MISICHRMSKENWIEVEEKFLFFLKYWNYFSLLIQHLETNFHYKNFWNWIQKIGIDHCDWVQMKSISHWNQLRVHFIHFHGEKHRVRQFVGVNDHRFFDCYDQIWLVWEMIEKQRDSLTCFSTGCPILDRTLNGGIRLGQITEIYGESGCGKTQFCIQLSLEVQRTFRTRGEEASMFFSWRLTECFFLTPSSIIRGRLYKYRITNR